MKNSILGIILICSIILSACGNNSQSGAEGVQADAQSLWTDSLKTDFINKNAESEYDKYVLNKFVEENEYEKDVPQLEKELNSESFKNYKTFKAMSYIVDIDELAGKSKSEIEKVLGKPDITEKVNPTNAPCPCDKYTYLDNLVEIVYIRDKADWITINNAPGFIDFSENSSFRSVDRFDDYTYIKVNTK